MGATGGPGTAQTYSELLLHSWESLEGVVEGHVAQAELRPHDPQFDADLVQRLLVSGQRPGPRLNPDLIPDPVTGSAAVAHAAVPPAELHGPDPYRLKPPASRGPGRPALRNKPPSTYQDEESQAYIAKKRASRENTAANSALVQPATRPTPKPLGGGTTSIPPAGRARSAPFLDRPEPQLPAGRASSNLLPTVMTQQHRHDHFAERTEQMGGGWGEDAALGGAEDAPDGLSWDRRLMRMTEEEAEAWAGIPLPANLRGPLSEGAPRKRAKTSDSQPGLTIQPSRTDADDGLPPPGALVRGGGKAPWLAHPPGAPQKDSGEEPQPPPDSAARGPIQPPGDPRVREPREVETRRKGASSPRERSLEKARPSARTHGRDKETRGERHTHNGSLPPPQEESRRQRASADPRKQGSQREEPREHHAFSRRGSPPREEARRHRSPDPRDQRQEPRERRTFSHRGSPPREEIRRHRSPDPREQGSEREVPRERRASSRRGSPPREKTRRYRSPDPREQGPEREERHARSRRGSPPRGEPRQQHASVCSPSQTLTEWRLTAKLHNVLEGLPPEVAMIVFDTSLAMVLRQQCRALRRESFSMDEVRQMIPMTKVSVSQARVMV